MKCSRLLRQIIDEYYGSNKNIELPSLIARALQCEDLPSQPMALTFVAEALKSDFGNKYVLLRFDDFTNPATLWGMKWEITVKEIVE